MSWPSRFSKPMRLESLEPWLCASAFEVLSLQFGTLFFEFIWLGVLALALGYTSGYGNSRALTPKCSFLKGSTLKSQMLKTLGSVLATKASKPYRRIKLRTLKPKAKVQNATFDTLKPQPFFCYGRCRPSLRPLRSLNPGACSCLD